MLKELIDTYEDLFCLLGLKSEYETKSINSRAPQSWMASNRPNKLVVFKNPIYMKEINKLPSELYNEP